VSRTYEFAKDDISSSNGLSTLLSPPKRNLGCAILASAIDDYLSNDSHTHRSAEQLLYPMSPEYREHYAWVVSMATGVNPAWLRDALDRFRKQWDRQRLEEELRARQKLEAARTPESLSAITA
jgi:hypothetical protein